MNYGVRISNWRWPNEKLRMLQLALGNFGGWFDPRCGVMPNSNGTSTVTVYLPEGADQTGFARMCDAALAEGKEGL